MKSRVRVAVLVAVGAGLAGFGAILFQVIGSGGVVDWQWVLAVALLVAVATLWLEWDAVQALWNHRS